MRPEWAPYFTWAMFCLLTGFFLFFGDELGGFTGLTGKGSITTETPGCLIRLFGFVLLIVQIVGLVGCFQESLKNGLIYLAILVVILLLLFIIAQQLD